MLLMVVVLLTDVCTVGSNWEPLIVCPVAVYRIVLVLCLQEGVVCG